jgi:hypothetical protein
VDAGAHPFDIFGQIERLGDQRIAGIGAVRLAQGLESQGRGSVCPDSIPQAGPQTTSPAHWQRWCNRGGRWHYQLYTSTALSNKRPSFTVTNEFHPLYKRCYPITNFSKCFGKTLVQYEDEEGLEKSINVDFTSLAIVRPFILINEGRCDFLFDDVLLLCKEIQHIKEGGLNCKPNCVIL